MYLNYTSSMNKSETFMPNSYSLLIFVLPIRIFGTATNLINVIIFSSKKFKDKAFLYLLYHSLAEFVYLLLESILSVPYCGHYCKDSIKYSLFAKILQIYVDEYLTSCLAILAILIEITVSFQRYLVVSNIDFCKIIKNGSPHLITIVLFFVSLLHYLPTIINFRVEKNPNKSNIYQVKTTIDGQIYKYFILVIIIIRGPIFTFIFTIISLFTLVKFKKQMKRKILITKSIKSKF
jgi:hypothetical protein